MCPLRRSAREGQAPRPPRAVRLPCHAFARTVPALRSHDGKMTMLRIPSGGTARDDHDSPEPRRPRRTRHRSRRHRRLEPDDGAALHRCAEARRRLRSRTVARSSSTPGSTPGARRRTSSSSTRPARGSGSGGVRSTSRWPRRASTASAPRSSGISRGSIRCTSSMPSPAPTPPHRIGVRVITGSPYHALFAKTMFITPTCRGGAFASSRTSSSCMRRPSRPIRRPTAPASGTFVVLHPTRGEVLIGGTFYAGEIKKAIFTVMNDRLPLEGVLPMHCSANVGEDGKRRGLLRALRHGQDDALGRSGALADRRRRARLGRRTASSTSRAAATPR